jgi:uncharacterized damage-inducible protein DinB
MKGSEIDRTVEQLRQVQEGGAWHGPSVREALEGVSAGQAARRPLEGAHSIWEIVQHVRVVEQGVRAVVTGQAAPDEPDWPAVAGTSEKAWQAALEELAAGQRALRDAVAGIPDARLQENVPGQENSLRYVLLGLLQHDAYHAGQIALLKAGLAG